MTGLVTIVSSQTASLAARFGNRALITTGLLVQCTGLIIIAALPATASLWAVAAAMVPVGAGGALTVPPIASLVLDHAPSGLAGTASGVLNTFRQLGGSLGVAAVGAIIAGHSVFMNGLRTGLIVTVAVLGVTAALSLTLHKPHNSTLDR